MRRIRQLLQKIEVFSYRENGMDIVVLTVNALTMLICVAFFLTADYGPRGIDKSALPYIIWLCVMAAFNLVAMLSKGNVFKWLQLRFSRMAKEEQSKIDQIGGDPSGP